MVVLRRLDALLEHTKDAVMEELIFQRDEAGFNVQKSQKRIRPLQVTCKR